MNERTLKDNLNLNLKFDICTPLDFVYAQMDIVIKSVFIYKNLFICSKIVLSRYELVAFIRMILTCSYMPPVHIYMYSKNMMFARYEHV